MATEEQRDLIDEFRETFPDVHTVEDTMRMCFQLKEDRDRWRKVADELYLSGNCSETCVDGAGGYDCSCSWGGAEWEYQQAVNNEG